MVNTVALYFGTGPTFISTVYLAACCRADVHWLLCQMFLHPGWPADKRAGRILFRAAWRRCSPWWISACGDGLDRHAAHVRKLTSAFCSHGGGLMVASFFLYLSSSSCACLPNAAGKCTGETKTQRKSIIGPFPSTNQRGSLTGSDVLLLEHLAIQGCLLDYLWMDIGANNVNKQRMNDEMRCLKSQNLKFQLNSAIGIYFCKIQ